MTTTQKKSLIAAISVLALESYDFVVFLFLAKGLSWAAFEAKPHGIGLLVDVLLALLARPVGGLILGSFADKYGRKPLLILTAFMMGTVTLLLGLIPIESSPVAHWGPLIFIIFRALQGMIFGADVLVSNVYLLELAPKEKRGFYAAFSQIGQDLGVLLAIFVSVSFLYVPTGDFFHQIGWRIPFISGSLSMLVGLFLRYQLHESRYFLQSLAKRRTIAPWFELLKHHKMLLVKVFSTIPVLGIAFYLFRVYFLNQSSVAQSLEPLDLLILSFFATLSSLFSTAIGAFLSDLCGRKPILVAGAVGILLLSWPTMILMSHPGESQMVFMRILVGEFVISLFVGLYGGALSAFITEQFPTHLRCTSFGFTYNVAMSFISGTLPLIDVYLYVDKRSISFFGLYLGFWALVAVFVISIKLPETYKKDISL